MSTHNFKVEDFPSRMQQLFSFRFDGAASSELLSAWRCTHSESRTTYTDPRSGLEVGVQWRRFDDFAAVEWVLEFYNGGAKDSPVIEQILPLDLAWPGNSEPAGDQIMLHHARGSVCRMDDFLPRASICRTREQSHISISPQNGRSSDGELPFFNVQGADGGVVVAIGWTGQWKFDLRCDEAGARLQAGMERTHLRLHPGERIRTPRILLIEWQGEDAVIGNNVLRQILLRHYCPRVDGELWIPPVAHMTMSTYHYTQQVSEAGELDALQRAADLGCEAFWVDACWYGSGGRWWEEVGNWQVRRDVFPRGLRPIADAAHERGMKFVLWFEPERVHVNSPFMREHPEWTVACDAPGVDRSSVLFNLALPEARRYMTDLISSVIEETGVDIYRQDFNMPALPFWRQMDAPDRVGMAEIRHIEAVYAMWDELRERHPGLCIDNCSSGGRRLDLETAMRSLPLWRSDFSDAGGPSFGLGLPVGDQSQTAGLSRWLPLHTAAVWKFSPYEARSAMAAGVVLYCDIRVEGFPADAARQAIAELKRLRPYFLGDFYPLLPLTIDYHDWCAYQYHRPDLNAGFAVFLRRHESPFPIMEAVLKGLDAQAEYDVKLRLDFDEPQPQRMTGAQLLQLRAEVPTAPGALLVEYSGVPA